MSLEIKSMAPVVEINDFVVQLLERIEELEKNIESRLESQKLALNEIDEELKDRLNLFQEQIDDHEQSVKEELLNYRVEKSDVERAVFGYEAGLGLGYRVKKIEDELKAINEYLSVLPKPVWDKIVQLHCEQMRGKDE